MEGPSRKPREQRRVQIVQAALNLLATSPVDALTTRAIAREVGVTQPGLFRHFRSRDEILTAVVTHTRDSMAKAAKGVFEQRLSPLASIRAILAAILCHANDNPGVPRLLFHDIGTDGDTSFHRALRLLVSTQRAMLISLLEDSIAQHLLPERIDIRRAADLGVASIQGLLLQWQLGDRQFDLNEVGQGFIEHWLAGLEAGQPASEERFTTKSNPTAEAAPPLVSIDVRPILHGGVDPVTDILALLGRLPADGLLEVVAPFRPAPLISLLGSRGLRTHCEALGGALWVVEILAAAAPEIIDLRELEAPEPLERVLLVTAEMAAGSALIFRLPRFPRLLVPHLDERGLTHAIHERADGSALLHLRRRA